MGKTTYTDKLVISAGEIIAGTYTPTLSAGVNVAASTTRLTKYIRVGNAVMVSGEIQIDPTAGAPTITTFELDLPVASDFSTVLQCSGSFTGTFYTQGGTIGSSIANNTASFYYMAVNAASDNLGFCFMYQVI